MVEHWHLKRFHWALDWPGDWHLKRTLAFEEISLGIGPGLAWRLAFEEISLYAIWH